MNISDVIGDIKKRLSLETIALPYTQPIETVLTDIIQTSVRTFSQFKPWEREGYCHIKDLRSPDDMSKKMNIYILPEDLTRTHVREAEAYMASSQYQDMEATTNAFTSGTPFVGFGAYYPQDIMNATVTGAAINKYAGVTSRPQTSRWLGFNKIQLFDFPGDAFIRFVVKCDHASVETIPDSCRESFMDLAILDVKASIYNALKNMNNTGGAFKETQVRIDDWSGAEDARNALVEKWTNTFHFDDPDLIQFF